MTTTARRLRLALLTALGMGTAGFWNSAAVAATFSNRPIDPQQVVAIASPIGNSAHQLLILEQLSNQRDCWQETGNAIDPLLLSFDFTDICGRGTDSNGYSIRAGGEDLGWRYSLQVQRQGDTLRLIARSVADRSAPDLEIGTAQMVPGRMVEISLNPGWSITKREYNGQVLGHYYLTHTEPIQTLLAAAPPRTPVVSPRPSTPSTSNPLPSNPLPSRPSTPSTTPSPSRPTTPTVPPPPRLITPGGPSGSGSPLPSTTDQAARLGLNYRVIVPASTSDVQSRVRAVVPDAFRTTINGEVVMQAGAFRERVEAEVLKQRLRIYSLQASILEIANSDLGQGNDGNSGSDRPTLLPPTTPPRQPSPPTSLPRVPNGRYVVVIDPGHGGRDPGAVGIGGLRETDIVLDISRQVASLLERQGVQVVMTRTSEQFIDLAPRVGIAERANADVFVSIHANAISMSRPEVNGAETYYYGSGQGRQLAASIQRSMIQRTGMVDRGVREARFYVIRNTSMPAALVETGFVTGSQDAARLRDPRFRTTMAEAIASGILDYLR